MKKKIFSILLCLILLFTVTACASSNPEGSTDILPVRSQTLKLPILTTVMKTLTAVIIRKAS